MKTRTFILSLTLAGMLAASLPANACTGITLNSKDSTTIVARTIEWGGSDLNSQYVIVPRGYTMRSYTPDGNEGMLRLCGACRRTERVHRRGHQRSGAFGWLVLFPQLRAIRSLRRGEKRHQHRRPAIGFVDIGQMRYDRRSDREREAGARYPHRPARLYRTLAFYRLCRQTSGLGDYRRRTEVLRKQVRCADQFPRIRMAADQPQ